MLFLNRQYLSKICLLNLTDEIQIVKTLTGSYNEKNMQ